MKLTPALNNMKTKGNKIARAAWDGKAHLEMKKGEATRVRKNGSVSKPRFMLEDVEATDWKVIK